MATITFVGISFFMWIQTEIPMGTDPIVEMVVALLSLLGLFYAVAFSMDSIVSEKALRTMPLIRSAPVSSLSIVLGKYAAVLATWVCILLASGLYFILGGRGLVGQADLATLLLGYASTLLVVGAMAAVGVFVSSISSSVKSSALGSLAFLFGFMGLSVARQLFSSFESVMDILDIFRNISILRYSGMMTEQLFGSGTDAVWGVLGLLAYAVVFIIASVAIVGLKEGDLP
jgi:ABC-type transport system involved in multi-copper enzyme maturation permease subunit